MRRQIVCTEEELDVMLNRMYVKGVFTGTNNPAIMQYNNLPTFKAQRDRARNELKEYSFK
jgi:hypothetical protein